MEDIGSRLILDTLPPPLTTPLTPAGWGQQKDHGRSAVCVVTEAFSQLTGTWKGPAPGERSDGRIRLTDTSFSDKGLWGKPHRPARRPKPPGVTLMHLWGGVKRVGGDVQVQVCMQTEELWKGEDCGSYGLSMNKRETGVFHAFVVALAVG